MSPIGSQVRGTGAQILWFHFFDVFVFHFFHLNSFKVKRRSGIVHNKPTSEPE